MAEVTRRRTGELLRKLFEILLVHPEGLQARDALSAVAAKVELTEYEKGTYAQGTRRFDKIVRFATIDLVKAGWLEKHKGRWIVTEEGKRAYEKHRDPETFYRNAIRLYNEWLATRPAKETATEPGEAASGSEDGSTARITFDQAEEQAWNEVEQYLRGIPWLDFQELVASLLRGMGYHVAWVSPPGKDGGIDILAWGDPLGTRPPRIKVQVKRRVESVSVEGLRSFMALLSDDDVGLFVSTGGFTKDAQELSRAQERRKVTLVDLERFFDLWVEHYGKLEDAARRKFPLQPIYFLAPQD